MKKAQVGLIARNELVGLVNTTHPEIAIINNNFVRTTEADVFGTYKVNTKWANLSISMNSSTLKGPFTFSSCYFSSHADAFFRESMSRERSNL